MAGRKKRIDRPTEWKVYPAFSIASKVDILLMDPTTGKAQHGARTRLIEGLLKKWLDEQGVQT